MVKREDIIKPLIFLDIFDYPPTAIELWRFLGVRAGLEEIVKILSSCCHSRESGNPAFVDSKLDPRFRGDDGGFYFLPGRERPHPSSPYQGEGIIEKRPFGSAQGRRKFFELSEKKFKVALRAAKILRFIPTIKMIAVCNNFYYHPESDIDFFIITSKNRLWLSRFFATLLLDIFRWRARGEETTDKICLSFYLSEDNLNLENIALKPTDPYLSYWLAFLEPIYGQEVYEKFFQANTWLKNIFPNILPKQPVSGRRIYKIFVSLLKFPLLDKTADLFEKMVKKIQWQKLSQNVKNMASLGDTRVVINNMMIKLHENDRREEFRKNYELRTMNYE